MDFYIALGAVVVVHTIDHLVGMYMLDRATERLKEKLSERIRKAAA